MPGLCTYKHKARLDFFLSPVNCGDPTSPMNGSIEPYQNTTEGAEISFMCNPMFVPTERMRAVCGADQRWSPDPADYRCTCEYHITLQLHISSEAIKRNMGDT